MKNRGFCWLMLGHWLSLTAWAMTPPEPSNSNPTLKWWQENRSQFRVETQPGIMFIQMDGVLVHYPTTPAVRSSYSSVPPATVPQRRSLFRIPLSSDPKMIHDPLTNRLYSLTSDEEMCGTGKRCIQIIDIQTKRLRAVLSVPDDVFPVTAPVVDLSIHQGMIYVHGVPPDSQDYVILRVPVPSGEFAPTAPVAHEQMDQWLMESRRLEESESAEAGNEDEEGNKLTEVMYEHFAIVCTQCEAQEAGMSPGRLLFDGARQRVAVLLDFGEHRKWYVLLDLQSGEILAENSLSPLASYTGIDPETGRMLVIRIINRGRDVVLSLHGLDMETSEFHLIGDLPRGLTLDNSDALMVPHLHRFYVKATEQESSEVIIVGIDYGTGRIVDTVRPRSGDYPLFMFYYPVRMAFHDSRLA